MGMTLARPNDGTFPDYNMCLGRVSKSGLSLSFDAGLLFELARALNRRDSKNLGVRLDLPSHCSGGIAVTPADGPEGAHGVIMPMHLDSETEAAYTRGMEAASRSARMLETIKETRDELKGLKSGIAKSLTLKLEDVLSDREERAQVAGRAMVVKKLKPFPVEAIVRGYLIGSGWKDYQKTGQVCGITLPTGLQQAAQLPEAIFTPSTKAELGAHDENIDFEKSVALMGREYAERVRDLAIRIYTEAAAFALKKGIVIADTKFEFGTDAAGNVVLIDEVLTPDSSRFWPLAEYRIGTSPPSFDKQFVRDYLETLTWDKKPPAPKLPPEILERTAAKYREALERLTK